jgi:hypothetical protein
MSRRLLSILGAAAVWAAIVAAAPHHHLKHDFYVVDNVTRQGVVGAVVTVIYADGMQQAETLGPHGNVQFRLPGEYEYVDVRVEADGYATLELTIRLGFRPHVGGRGIWLTINPVAPAR